jgi:hypothetical protein
LQLQIDPCEDGMYLLNGFLRISFVGGYFSGTLEGGQMGNNLEFFIRFLVSFWCFDYFITTSVRLMNGGMNWGFTIMGLIFETQVFGKCIVAATGLCVWQLCTC